MCFDDMIKKLVKVPTPIELIASYLDTPYGPGLDVFRYKKLNKGIYNIVNKLSYY